MLISGPFPLIKPQNQKPMVLNGQYVSKNSENWYLGSSYIETIGFRRPAHKKGLFISILMTRRERCNIKGITEENFAETICSGPTLNYMCNATKFRLNNTIREKKHKNTQKLGNKMIKG